MPDSKPTRIQPALTPARISLGLTGPAIPTQEQLRFQLDHALARDAVHAQLDIPLLLRGLRERNLEGLTLKSAAADRRTYLRRPDLGRTLHPDSIAALRSATNAGAQSGASDVRDVTLSGAKIAFILADGLSALALERHALSLLDATIPLITSPLSPIPVVSNARVAIADHIGQLLGAHLTVLLIGERPGLSSPDSLGVYLTWEPRAGRNDAERNCISNIRHEGLGYADAAHRIVHYIAEAQRLQTTGTALKDPVSVGRLSA